MADRIVGYEFLRESLNLPAFAPETTARAGGVTRKKTFGDSLVAVPVHVAPASDDPLEHLLFALKHEPLNLQIAILALQKIPAKALARVFIAKPRGWYARQACYLWELANGKSLSDLPAAGGPCGLLFSPDKFLTAASTRSSRWRIDFNGIGSPRYCVTVRRTPTLDALPGSDILGRVLAFVDGTECVEFGLHMAQEALDRDLQNESAFLQRFDRAYRAVNDAVDMNNDDLVLMVRSVLQNDGALSNNRRKQLVAKGHPPALLDRAMAALTECLADEGDSPPAPVARA